MRNWSERHETDRLSSNPLFCQNVFSDYNTHVCCKEGPGEQPGMTTLFLILLIVDEFSYPISNNTIQRVRASSPA